MPSEMLAGTPAGFFTLLGGIFDILTLHKLIMLNGQAPPLSIPVKMKNPYKDSYEVDPRKNLGESRKTKREMAENPPGIAHAILRFGQNPNKKNQIKSQKRKLQRISKNRKESQRILENLRES